MRRISVYLISILWFVFNIQAYSQDTINVVLKAKVGIDIAGPVINLMNKDQLSIEGSFSWDINEKRAISVEAGYSNNKYIQYNYGALTSGAFLRAGFDFNLLSPLIANSRYYAGIGLKYGISLYESEISTFRHENYWGSFTGSIPVSNHFGHFIELSPGIRTEIFKNFSIGWTIRLSLLVYSGTGKDIEPIYIPGYGNGTKSFSPGISYYLTWSIPTGTKVVITKKKAVPAADNKQNSAR